ncbi:hypothetical protein NMY22_g12531 [Coprinellus aureogranulatus]|nr:hypothetical protein NMY22_g12531 [Coprinellus aureogranulatus]
MEVEPEQKTRQYDAGKHDEIPATAATRKAERPPSAVPTSYPHSHAQTTVPSKGKRFQLTQAGMDASTDALKVSNPASHCYTLLTSANSAGGTQNSYLPAFWLGRLLPEGPWPDSSYHEPPRYGAKAQYSEYMHGAVPYMAAIKYGRQP